MYADVFTCGYSRTIFYFSVGAKCTLDYSGIPHREQNMNIQQTLSIPHCNFGEMMPAVFAGIIKSVL